MITLRFTFHEIMDTDFTAVEVEILEAGKLVDVYRNYDADQLHKEIYANQAEEFCLPSIACARSFIESTGRYRRIAR